MYEMLDISVASKLRPTAIHITAAEKSLGVRLPVRPPDDNHRGDHEVDDHADDVDELQTFCVLGFQWGKPDSPLNENRLDRSTPHNDS